MKWLLYVRNSFNCQHPSPHYQPSYKISSRYPVIFPTSRILEICKKNYKEQRFLKAKFLADEILEKFSDSFQIAQYWCSNVYPSRCIFLEHKRGYGGLEETSDDNKIVKILTLVHSFLIRTLYCYSEMRESSSSSAI